MTWEGEFWHAAILAGGVAAGLVFVLAVTGIGFVLAGWIAGKKRRKCQHCQFSGGSAEVIAHEELDH